MTMKTAYFLTCITAVFVLSPLSAVADSNWWFSSSKKGVAPVTNTLYKKECSACHYAYQPGLLPARSWKKLFSNLENHFDEDASLSADEEKQLMQYAMNNAADKSDHKRSVKINRSISRDSTPIRITQTKYIIRKHHELSNRHVKNNPEVKTLARCDACHTKIDTGSFSEGEIKIPGIGYWED